MSSQEDYPIVTAGASEYGTPWMYVRTGRLSYENYIALIEMLIEQMRDEYGSQFSEARLENDLRYLLNAAVAARQDDWSAENNQEERLYLKAKDLRSGRHLNLEVRLTDLVLVQLYTTHIVISTTNDIFGLIPRVIFRELKHLKKQPYVIAALAHRRLKFIVFSYPGTINSLGRLIIHAEITHRLEDHRQLDQRQPHHADDFPAELLSRQHEPELADLKILLNEDNQY